MPHVDFPIVLASLFLFLYLTMAHVLFLPGGPLHLERPLPRTWAYAIGSSAILVAFTALALVRGEMTGAQAALDLSVLYVSGAVPTVGWRVVARLRQPIDEITSEERRELDQLRQWQQARERAQQEVLRGNS
jgi:hypothetical protein